MCTVISCFTLLGFSCGALELFLLFNLSQMSFIYSTVHIPDVWVLGKILQGQGLQRQDYNNLQWSFFCLLTSLNDHQPHSINTNFYLYLSIEKLSQSLFCLRLDLIPAQLRMQRLFSSSVYFSLMLTTVHLIPHTHSSHWKPPVGTWVDWQQLEIS